MRTIKLSGVITSIRAKVDGSLGFSTNTPELSKEEKTEFFGLQNQNIEITLKPTDFVDAPKLEVNKDLERKTPSQRMRNVIYVLWQHSGSVGYFDDFYRSEMERSIENYKRKLQ